MAIDNEAEQRLSVKGVSLNVYFSYFDAKYHFQYFLCTFYLNFM